MTFRVSSGSRPPYYAMHDVMVGLRLPTALLRWVGWSLCLFCVVLSASMLIEGIATCRCRDRSRCTKFGHTVPVWGEYGEACRNVQWVAW